MIPSDPLRGGPAGIQGVDAVSANTCTPGGTKINWQALEEFFFNTDPNKVLQSQGLSFYKGIPVFTIEGERSGSFGAIFLTKKAKGAVDGTDTLRHEYGHTIQLAKLGVLKFSVCVGLPSWQNWGDDSYYKDYYNKPWEIMADVYGGVQSRTHDQKFINEGIHYEQRSQGLGPFVWMFIE